MVKAVGARPGAVEAWPTLWGRCNVPWGCDQDRGGATKTVRACQGPWGRSQDHRGATKIVWVPLGLVGAWPRP